MTNVINSSGARNSRSVWFTTATEQHLGRIESLFIQVEYELLEIKRVLGLPFSQETLLQHLNEHRQSALAPPIIDNQQHTNSDSESDLDEPIAAAFYRGLRRRSSDGEDDIDCSAADRK